MLEATERVIQLCADTDIGVTYKMLRFVTGILQAAEADGQIIKDLQDYKADRYPALTSQENL